MNDTDRRLQNLTKRVFKLEVVIDKLITAIAADTPQARAQALSEAQEAMPS